MSVSAVGGKQCDRIARCAGLLLSAVLLAGCTAAAPTFGDGAYANCRDLGDLALTAESRADAEQRMRAQVLERGGDTLLFGVRARAQRGIVPEEIAERRNQLTSADAGRPGAVAVSPDAVGESPDAPHAEAGLLDDELRPPADRGGARRGRISVEPQAATPGELWYYGAALRCNG